MEGRTTNGSTGLGRACITHAPKVSVHILDMRTAVLHICIPLSSWYKCPEGLPHSLQCFFRLERTRPASRSGAASSPACTCAVSQHITFYHLNSKSFHQYASNIEYRAIVLHCDRVPRSGLCWKYSSCLVSLEAFQRPHFCSLLDVLAYQKSFAAESLS